MRQITEGLRNGRPMMDEADLERRIVILKTRNAVDDVHRSNVGERLGAI